MKTPLYIPKNHFDGRNLWLLKAVNLNRGRCIKLIDSKENCEDIIRNFYQGIQKNKIDDKDKIFLNVQITYLDNIFLLLIYHLLH